MFKLDKASGLDRFVLRLLIETDTVLSNPLIIIFNKSLKDGIDPSEWKKANVSAISKKGSRCCAGHYRSVSLTSHVCKVHESIFRDIIINQLSKYKLINQSQHVLLQRRSCLTNLLEFLQSVSSLIDQGLPVDIIYRKHLITCHTSN